MFIRHMPNMFMVISLSHLDTFRQPCSLYIKMGENNEHSSDEEDVSRHSDKTVPKRIF